MPKKRITKKINSSHIVWFEESNYWTQFEEPAWYIYLQFNSGFNPENISRKFSQRYSLNAGESLIFVNDIIKEIRKLSTASFVLPKIAFASEFISPSAYFSIRTYLINQKVFEISFMTHELEYMIHQSFAHLEVINITNPRFRLETLISGTSFVLKINEKAWAENDASLLRRRIFIEISSLIYGKSDDDWLSFVHGSSVSNGKEGIILSTSRGSGKSTMAALLCNQGLHFVSDDYVPIDSRFCKIYPFPAALSVKNGAYPLLVNSYDQLKTARVFHFKGSNKTVRYLSFPMDKNFYRPIPVRNIIFIQYNPLIPFSFRKVPTLEAIRRFNEEAWVSSLPANARKFIKWFPTLNCFELEYSDKGKAIREIMALFKNE